MFSTKRICVCSLAIWTFGFELALMHLSSVRVKTQFLFWYHCNVALELLLPVFIKMGSNGTSMGSLSETASAKKEPRWEISCVVFFPEAPNRKFGSRRREIHTEHAMVGFCLQLTQTQYSLAANFSGVPMMILQLIKHFWPQWICAIHLLRWEKPRVPNNASVADLREKES